MHAENLAGKQEQRGGEEGPGYIVASTSYYQTGKKKEGRERPLQRVQRKEGKGAQQRLLIEQEILFGRFTLFEDHLPKNFPNAFNQVLPVWPFPWKDLPRTDDAINGWGHGGGGEGRAQESERRDGERKGRERRRRSESAKRRKRRSCPFLVSRFTAWVVRLRKISLRPSRERNRGFKGGVRMARRCRTGRVRR